MSNHLVRGGRAYGRVVVLAWLPMAAAMLGAWIDERRALGFTTWRSACRASGISISSIATFTLELLPTAVIGALLGGLVVLAAGIGAGGERRRAALASHAGCVAAMPVGVLLCALAWPWPLTLAADFTLASVAAAATWWLARIRRATYARPAGRGVSRIPRAPSAPDNFPRQPTPENA